MENHGVTIVSGLSPRIGGKSWYNSSEWAISSYRWKNHGITIVSGLSPRIGGKIMV